MEKGKKTAWLQSVWGKYKYAALVGAAGLLLLAWPARGGPEAPAEAVRTESRSGDAESLEAAEERMERILSRIEGVGALDLMLTVESTDRREFAVDTELSYSGATAAPDDYTRRTETVVVDSGGGDAPVTVRRDSPAYRGALVVCEGAGSAEVRLAVTEAVASLTGLSSDRISVAKLGKSGNT